MYLCAMSEWEYKCESDWRENNTLTGEILKRWCIVHQKRDAGTFCPLVVIGINPSGGTSVDENGNVIFSPTARKIQAIADGAGKNGIILINLFSFATKSVKALLSMGDVELERNYTENKEKLGEILGQMSIPHDTPVLLCFGNAIRRFEGKDYLKGILETDGLRLLKDFRCIGSLTKNGKGYPRHPLYCRNDSAVTPLEHTYKDGVLKFKAVDEQ